MDIELAQALAENELLKSLLYCIKRSCNNCGKVNCENFQRQRIDCCGKWVSYKDYITELEQQIEQMKCCGNCRFSESDKLNGTFCHREGCFVVASAKCILWEN